MRKGLRTASASKTWRTSPVSERTIRIWEKRYNLLIPKERTPMFVAIL